MKEDKLLIIVAVVAVVVSVLSAGFTYLSIANLAATITGFQTSIGTANLTVESQIAVNFTTNIIDWGNGRVDIADDEAYLNTYETNNVSGGNWTLVTGGGLRIENIGNANFSLNLSGSKTAAAFIGGTNPFYRWNITNSEAGSCVNATGETGTLNLDLLYDVNTTTTLFCDTLRFETANDEIRIDFNLTIPEDSQTGVLGDIITATAWTS